jgi:hypothetical protein
MGFPVLGIPIPDDPFGIGPADPGEVRNFRKPVFYGQGIPVGAGGPVIGHLASPVERAFYAVDPLAIGHQHPVKCRLIFYIGADADESRQPQGQPEDVDDRIGPGAQEVADGGAKIVLEHMIKRLYSGSHSVTAASTAGIFSATGNG